MASSIANCIYRKTGARMPPVGKRLIFPRRSALRGIPELALRMVQRAQAADLPIRWVVADTVYGHSSDLRNWLEEQGYAHALAVPSTEVVCVQTRTGVLLADVASIAQQALRAQDWHRLSASLGTKGER